MKITGQKLNDTPRQKGFRAWIRFGPEDKWPRPTLSIAAHAGKPVYRLGGYLHVEADEDPLSAGLYVWPFSFYASVESKSASAIARRLVGTKWDSEREVQVVISTRDEIGTVRWKLWSPSMSWSSTTPKWRDGSWNLFDAVLGQWQYSNEVLSTHDVVIPMPEKAYPATVKLELSTWRRKRFPFITRSMKRANIDVPGGIPHEGKGENAWDCGEDATFSMTCPADTLHDAIGHFVSAVMRYRLKYGGSVYHRREEAAAA